MLQIKAIFLAILVILAQMAPAAAVSLDEWVILCKSETARDALRKQLEGMDATAFDAEAASRCPRIGLPDKPVHDSAETSRDKSHTDWIYDAHYSADGSTILSASRDGSIGLWDAASGKMIRRIVMPASSDPNGYGWVRSAVFVGDGKTIAGAKDTMTVQLYATADGASQGDVPFAVAKDSFFPPRMAATAKDLLLLAGDSDTVDAIDVATKTARYKLAGHGKKATAVAVSETADLIATASPGEEARGETKGGPHRVFLWKLSTGEKIASLEIDGRSEPDRLSFSRDGAQLAVVSGGTVHIYATADKRETQKIVVHPMFSVFDAAFTADGKGLISCQSHPVLWDLSTGKIVRHYGPFNDLCHSVDISPDGKYALTTSMASDLKVWDIVTGTFERRLGIDVKPPR